MIKVINRWLLNWIKLHLSVDTFNESDFIYHLFIFFFSPFFFSSYLLPFLSCLLSFSTIKGSHCSHFYVFFSFRLCTFDRRINLLSDYHLNDTFVFCRSVYNQSKRIQWNFVFADIRGETSRALPHPFNLSISIYVSASQLLEQYL